MRERIVSTRRLTTEHSTKAPVTTFVAKDRVLAHNPLGAVYCQCVRRKMTDDGGV